MTLPDEAKLEQLRMQFEGREAIYRENGQLRVLVSKIRWNIAERSIFAVVEEIPTAGLPTGALCKIQRNERSLLRLNIGAGSLAYFTDHTWHMGYGGWSLLFAPEIANGVVQLAVQVPMNLDPLERQMKVGLILNELEDKVNDKGYQEVFSDK
jgi:hypothetical protein